MTGAMAISYKAGGIVFRVDEDDLWFLLVTGRSNPRDWIFPKGNLEEGESGEQAAVREVREESGVEARVEDYVGSARYATNNGLVHIDYYLLSFLAEGETDEPRRVRWCRYDRALDLVAFDTLKELLPKARRLVEERG